jgi:GNAT superfamily N-acetyltransferase
LHEAMTKKNQHFFLLEGETGAVGFASCTPHHARSTVTHLNKLYVLPSTQGTGAGGTLLHHVIRYAGDHGDKVIELNVNKRNKAIGFYEHQGFTIVREEVIDIGSGYVMDDYVMGRSLASSR